MPTGYTAGIEEGDMSFEEFVWYCATAFFYDTARMPEQFKITGDYAQKIADTKARIAEFETISDLEVANRQAASRERYQTEYKKSIKRAADLTEKYQMMIRKVENWSVPTPDHEALKKFMLRQLEESLKWDCYSLDAQAAPVSTEEYRATVLADLRDHLKFCEERQKTEEENVEKSNKWMAALKASVPRPHNR